MAVDRYSRFVSIIKVALPLIALVLLSTVFLLSRNADPISTIPFAESDLKQRLADQVITGPVFAGLNATGDEMVVEAETLRAAGENEQEADHLQIDFQLANGTTVVLTSQDGRVNILKREAILEKDVLFRTSKGTTFATEALIAQMEPLSVVSPGAISGRSPFGTLNAGSMRLETAAETGKRLLVFSNGVRVVYQPETANE